jgi:CubicO group peptidase (beta-lactamase class C family)
MISVFHSRDLNPYYPPPESQGGWRWLDTLDAVQTKAGMDADKLDQLFELQEFLFGSYTWGIVIIRHGYLVREHYTFLAQIPSRFDSWSCTKSFTGTAWGLLLDDSHHGRLPDGQKVDLDSPAYSYIPEGHPLSDPRKEAITIRHLLTMTSGIPGESMGRYGTTTTTGNGPFEHALGRCANRYHRWVDKLAAEPGTTWDYSDPAIAHLSLIFAHVTGQEIHDYMNARIFYPIGIERTSWDILGGSGFIGPHTNPHTGLHISARELARFGYLALHQGVWNGKQLIPQAWMELATHSSQDLNPDYGYTWWVNTKGTHWPGLPTDMFALEGYNSNRCYVIPSLDLVVARVGSGPPRWNEPDFIGGVVATIMPD